MNGLFELNKVRCCGIDKKDMKDGSYYYEVAFTTGKRVIQLTTGKKGDILELDKYFNVVLDYDSVKKKLLITDIEHIK